VRWNLSIFPVVVGDARWGQPVRDRVVAADLVEQHLTALTEAVGELLAIEFLTDVKLRRLV
jgi:hypothetical protein